MHLLYKDNRGESGYDDDSLRAVRMRTLWPPNFVGENILLLV